MSDHSAVMTAREAALLFNDSIRPGLAGPPASRDQPVYVGVGGPPGIGKSSAQAAIQRQLGLRDAYVLDGDDLLAHWPGFEAAQQRNTLTASYLASEATAAGNWWQARPPCCGPSAVT